MVELSKYVLPLILVVSLGGIAAYGLSTIEWRDYILLFKGYMSNLEDILLEAGIYGPIIIFFIYLVTTVFMLPLWGFHMTCGYVYGTFWSALLIATTQALCAGVAFSVSRYLVGPYVKGFLQRKYGAKYDAIDRAVGKDGFKITLLLRLSPIIPFGFNNYLCGCTQMKLWEFVLGTFLGVLPGTTAYCNMGAMGKQAMDKGTTVYQKVAMGLGVIAGLAVVKVLSDLATNALKEAGIDDKAAISKESAASKKAK